jgi:hypothetical protein
MESGKTFKEAMDSGEFVNGQFLDLLGGDMVKESEEPVIEKVHSIDITPSMRESVLQDGQPLFKTAPTWEQLKQNN